MQQKLKKYIHLPGLFLLSLFMTYQACIIMFAHVHIVNGVMLVHSHPFSQQHNHSDGQTLVLHHLSTYHSLEASPSFALSVPAFFLIAVFFIAACQRVVLRPAVGLYLRAPPVLL